jgi:ATP-binding cassette subfamily B protein
MLSSALMALFAAEISKLPGKAFNIVVSNNFVKSNFSAVALSILGVSFVLLVINLLNYYFIEVVSSRMESDTREELYVNLLGKSQTFHNSHRSGDIMASASNDVWLLNGMTNPGVSNLFNAIFYFIVPIVLIASINSKLLIIPVIYNIIFFISLRQFAKKFAPIATNNTESYSQMNADLKETLSGISLVKATSNEKQIFTKFIKNITWNRDVGVMQAKLQSFYLPALLYGVALIGSFIYSIFLYRNGEIHIGDIIAYIGFLQMLMPIHQDLLIVFLVLNWGWLQQNEF